MVQPTDSSITRPEELRGEAAPVRDRDPVTEAEPVRDTNPVREVAPVRDSLVRETNPPREPELEIEVEVNPTGGASETVDELGKCKRVKFPSVKLKPYVTNAAFTTDTMSSSTCLYPIANYVSPHRLSSSQQAFLAKIVEAVEAEYLKDAVKYRKWCVAMGLEIDALEHNNTWDIMKLPPGIIAIGCKWVFRINFKSDGTIERFKARLVAPW